MARAQRSARLVQPVQCVALIGQKLEAVAQAVRLVSAQHPWLSEHSLHQASHFVPLSPDAGSHEAVACRGVGAMSADNGGNDGSNLIDGLHAQPRFLFCFGIGCKRRSVRSVPLSLAWLDVPSGKPRIFRA